jgi:hypothetical protein
MMTTDLPDISELNTEELLALRETIDGRLEEMKGELIAQAERLGLAVTNGAEKKRRGRKPKAEEEMTE